MTEANDYQALLVVSFGGPEGPDEVIPFLENVLRGRNVPPQRLLEVARHYQDLGGVSPINEQNRRLISAVRKRLKSDGPELPIYFGNRNWKPFLTDTVRQMAEDGITRALAFVTAAYSSYSSCRQYRENIASARESVGSQAPEIHKLRVFYNHPGFIAANADHVRAAFAEIPESRRSQAKLVFTAHSIPLSMAANCRYVSQLREASRLIADAVGADGWSLAFQSRSGPPTQPWLDPDILDHLSDLMAQGVHDVVVSPVGFISDHMEVLYDLDVEARQHSETIGINMVRAASAGEHPRFIEMIRHLILERVSDQAPRLALGRDGPGHDFCPPGCCVRGT